MSSLFNTFFEELENEIRSKLDSIRCKDIHDLYYNDFWDTLKEKVGSSDGFTGLSEVIVFIILKELIEKEYGKLKRRKHLNDTYHFYNQKFAIGRGLTIRISKNKRKPDIVIWKNPEGDLSERIPDCAIEVKLYSTGGIKTVKEAIDRLKALKDALKLSLIHI